MAFWSTYTPVGVSLGLLMSGFFAGTSDWRGGYWLHLVLFAALAFTSPLLPHVTSGSTGLARPAGLFSVWKQSGPLRLSLAFAALLVMGFGLTTIYPDWFARQHAVQVGDASKILSIATLVMIPGGLAAGVVLARGWRHTAVLAGLMVTAVVISLPVFMPDLPMSGRIAALVVWMLVQGAAVAVVTGSLPRVVRDPMQGAAAAGLLSQLAALVTFVTPLIWQPILQSGQWPGFIAVVALAAAAAWMLFPRRNSAG
jgi:hypothetical protein